MKDTKGNQIREVDESGVLITSGFKFDEGVMVKGSWSGGCLFAAMCFIAMLFAPLGIMGAFLGYRGSTNWFVFAVSAFALAASAAWLWRNINKPIPMNKITLVFRADGRISASDKPKGPLTDFTCRIEDIGAISSRPLRAIGGGHGHYYNGQVTRPGWEVVLDLKDGQSIEVARPIPTQDDAEYIAIQLNQALRALRQAHPALRA